RLLVTRDLTRLDADNLRHTVGRIDGQITHSESRLHDYVDSLLKTVFKAREIYHARRQESMHSRLAERPFRACQFIVSLRCRAGIRGSTRPQTPSRLWRRG